jgi:hypothetical protein
VDASDPWCPGGQQPSSFPERIGKDGLFEVTFQPSDHQTVHFDLKPAAPGIIEEENATFAAKSSGVVALLAKRTSDGRILDFVHVTVVDVSALSLEEGSASPPIVWQPGEQHTLSVIAVDSDQAPLAGARPFTWSTDNPIVLGLDRASPSPTMDLTARSSGHASLTVTTGTSQVVLSLTVSGGTSSRDAGHGPPPDGGSTPVHDAGPDGRAVEAGARDSGTDATLPGDGGPP